MQALEYPAVTRLELAECAQACHAWAAGFNRNVIRAVVPSLV